MELSLRDLALLIDAMRTVEAEYGFRGTFAGELLERLEAVRERRLEEIERGG